ncbi:hypothetical protein BY458DRAFT_440980 [Sporodiniella umbellata]|nr:hypothetical protein BY458DRAFT_440980 [Sporodiniella umbellata]
MSEQTPTENKNSLSEAEKFLESLNLTDSGAQENENDSTDKPTTDPNEIMSFLDEISNYPTSDPKQPSKEPVSKETPVSSEQKPDNGWMSWGNNFWNQASAAVKTTTDQINRSVGSSDAATKLLETRVKDLQNLVNKENIEKLGTGLKSLTNTILETVAPPISEHELVEVWLAYDMEGYEGLEALVYRSFARVMEHTESGRVTVRNPKGDNSSSDERNLHICDSLADGTKLAKANIDYLLKQHYTPKEKETEKAEPQTENATPIIHCPVFMAIQPVKLSMPAIDEGDEETHQLSFIIVMVDPSHNLKFKSYSQTVALDWLDVPYEENEWVEDKLVEVIRMSVTTIAQDYVWTRMSGGTSNNHSENETGF